ncbi:amidase family protein [Streptomyces sp. NPDC001635]
MAWKGAFCEKGRGVAVRGEPLVAGSSAGPLRRVGVAVKDLFVVAGQRIGAGNPAWLAETEEEPSNAWAVGALLAAGADVLGIAHTDEFAYSLSGTNAHYGTPPNPAAPGRVPGGSSSGPASAVGLRQADAGLGSDTAGSIRVPASYCGLLFRHQGYVFARPVRDEGRGTALAALAEDRAFFTARSAPDSR